MRRQDIQLIALARQGDAAARCEAGRRYLSGSGGFPKHVATGIDYLSHRTLAHSTVAATILAESLPLEDLIRLNQEAALKTAATHGSAIAQAKLGGWLCVRHGELEAATRWLDQAARGGHQSASRACAVLMSRGTRDAAADCLVELEVSGDLHAAQVATVAARHALDARDLRRLAPTLHAALRLSSEGGADLAPVVSSVVLIAETEGLTLEDIDAAAIERVLEWRSYRGDRDAAYALGRALCGIACGALAPGSLAGTANLRKGVALLLRAADAGSDGAWLHLFRLHGDHRLSVANPQMARFCLEKAASGGQPEAQRKLGALMLRASTSISDTEQSIEWLHRSAAAGDRHAIVLLRSLVLPVSGDAVRAQGLVDQVEREDPWLGARLRLSRAFGLTRLEALTVDPSEALRPWGVVVGRNKFVSQAGLAAPRAIPAVNAESLEVARRSAALFGESRADSSAFEGDLRRRSMRQRRLFARYELEDSMCFASATTTVLDALRHGAKWAYHSKDRLRLALAA